MKNIKFRISVLLLCLLLALSSCKGNDGDIQYGSHGGQNGESPDLGGFDDAYGEDLGTSEIYDGYFEGDTVNITVECVSGTKNAYKLEGNTLTFTAVAEDSVYSVKGELKGNIVIDTGDGYKFDLEMQGLSIVSDAINPITVKSGDEVSLTAKKETKNYIYDTREAIDTANEELFSAAVHSEVDLEICGKGELTLVSENNNGIHSKDDLQVKNLTLFVTCKDNALKGNDSVEIADATTTLIASAGDAVKTQNSDVSDKGNQRGSVTVSGGTHTFYAASDGIDAAYDVIVDGESTVLNIYTDKYSNYSEEITAVDGNNYYIRFTSKDYKYSVRYSNSGEGELWVNAEYHSSVQSQMGEYYYYSFPKKTEYGKMQFFVYSADMDQGQAKEYVAASENLTPNAAYDTFALESRGGGLAYSWTNYTTSPQEGIGGMIGPSAPGGRPGGGGGRPGGSGAPGGMGGAPSGMGGGNNDKSEHSAKGIKAANEVKILAGNITVKAYDDAIHANADTALENGASPLGNVTVSGGALTLYSNDDGIHADNALLISGGTVKVTNSYEGLEGTSVSVTGGSVAVAASDDGINGTAGAGTAIAIKGGDVYVYCKGDGFDSNSRESYAGIVFSGGNTVIISNSGGNSSIDSERGYAFEGGRVLAVMPSGGMSGEATNCKDFKSVATSKSLSLAEGDILSVSVDGKTVLTLKMPCRISGTVIYLGSSSANLGSGSSSPEGLDSNGVLWS